MSLLTQGIELVIEELRPLLRRTDLRFDRAILDRIERLRSLLAVEHSRTEEPTVVAEAISLVAAPTSAGKFPKREKFRQLEQTTIACRKCPHLVAFRHQVVFGVGNPDAELMFVGEAPGADEDLQGEPFVGRAGELLTRIIQTMGFSRDEVYIANVLKCRPDMPPGRSGNRPPTAEEMATCLPYLREQIALIQPKLMVALGGVAMRGLLGADQPMKSLRGHWHQFAGIPVMPTFHPSYLLRNQSLTEKRKVWEDMLLVLERLKRPITERQRNFFLAKS
ncbi:MAG TPA: uracil-DNA glycosylase [Chthoniobacterales bacterium]|nr:uracil-DNA glycosylase [Chthoniobacterales bacterium]